MLSVFHIKGGHQDVYKRQGKEFPDAELLKVKIERCKNEIEHLIWRQTELAKLENLLHKQENVRCV